MNCSINISYSCYFVKFLERVFQIFCVPVLSSYSINYGQKGVDISDYNLDFSIYWYTFMNLYLLYFDSVISSMYI